MTNSYHITPTTDNAIQIYYSILSTDQINAWSVTETYQQGYARRELDNPIRQHDIQYDNMQFTVDGSACNGSPTDYYFKFDETFSQEDIDSISASWRTNGSTGLDGSKWILNHSYIRIMPPVRIDLIDSNGNTIAEDVSPVEY